MDSYWSLSESMSPQVSRFFPANLADFNYAVIWRVLTCPVISKSSSFCTTSLVSLPRVPITIGIIVTFRRKIISKRYLILPCCTLSIIRYASRVKLINPVKKIVPSPTPWCCSYWKGSFRDALDYDRQLYFYLLL